MRQITREVNPILGKPLCSRSDAIQMLLTFGHIRSYFTARGVPKERLVYMLFRQG